MKNGFSVFIAAFIALGASWCGFVLAPVLQLGTAKQTSVLMSGDTYPVQRTGDATLGLQVYRANGCAACHTEQIQQSGVVFDVVVTGAGKNVSAVGKVLGDMISIDHLFGTNDLPKTILHGVNKIQADAASDKITAAGGKVETHLIPTGADIARGWGVRHSVAADFLYDNPVQTRQPAHRAGSGELRRAVRHCEIAVATSLRAAKRREKFRDAAVPFSF